MTTPASHAHTANWVCDVLRRRISGGVLLPGSKLAEASLAQELGVSRNTLREAFRTLAGESIVVRHPNRGVFVLFPEIEDIHEIYRTRSVIEPGAVLWGEMSGEIAAQLARLRDRIEAGLREGDVPGLANANQDLHRAVVALSHSPTLVAMMDQVSARMRLVFHSMAEIPGFHPHFAQRNLEVIALVTAQRRDDAAQALRSYLADAQDGLVAHKGRTATAARPV